MEELSMKNRFVELLAIKTFLIMIIVNALANILPINGIGSGEVSDKYANLFAPAGFTFSIWIIIYFFLFCYVIFQFINTKLCDAEKQVDYRRIAIIFSISSTFNSMWIFAWHYEVMILSLIFMIIILTCLFIINNITHKMNLSRNEKLLIKLPFSIYFGWITVATIANVTTLLVSLEWNRFGISEQIWAVLIIAVGAVIGIINIVRLKDYAYGLVILWAYFGILMKHVSDTGFQNTYPEIIITVTICMILIVLSEIKLIREKLI